MCIAHINPSIKKNLSRSFNELLTVIANAHAPITKYRIKGIYHPWMTSALLNAMKERDNFHRKTINQTQNINGINLKS